MAGSAFLELIDEERKIPRGEVGAFPSVEHLKRMLEARAEFADHVQKAYSRGKITSQQRDQLIDLNRKNSLPPGTKL